MKKIRLFLTSPAKPLYFLLLVLCFLVINILIIPMPTNVSSPEMGDITGDLNTPHTVYKLRGTEVKVVKGSYFMWDKYGFDSQMLLISAKHSLSDPYKDSLDAKSRSNLCKSKPECTLKYQRHLEQLFNASTTKYKNGEPVIWYAKIGSDWDREFEKNFQWPKLIYFAGIEVESSHGVTSSQKIEEGISRLCLDGHVTKLRSITLPYIGGGARLAKKLDTSLSHEEVMNTLFTGINKAIVKGQCPDTIYIMLYPGNNWEKCQKANCKDYIAKVEGTNWRFKGEMIAKLLRNADSYLHYNNVWIIKKNYIHAIQVLVVMLSLAISTFIAQKTVMVTWGMLFQHAGYWLFITLGTSMGQPFLAKVPLSENALLLVVILALIIPAWRWIKLGEPANPDVIKFPVSNEMTFENTVKSIANTYQVNYRLEGFSQKSVNQSMQEMDELAEASSIKEAFESLGKYVQGNFVKYHVEKSGNLFVIKKRESNG